MLRAEADTKGLLHFAAEFLSSPFFFLWCISQFSEKHPTCKTFSSPGSNVKLETSVASALSPFWRLLKEAEEWDDGPEKIVPLSICV